MLEKMFDPTAFKLTGSPAHSADKEAAAHPHQQQQQPRRLEATTPVTADVVLSESAVSVSEGGTGATYTVVLNADPGTPVNVDISTASSEISLSGPQQLVFLPADWNTAQPVTVSAVDDDVVESLVEVAVTHSVEILDTDFVWNGTYSPSGANLNVRVYDNDEAGVLVSASTLYMDEGGPGGTYNVKLMGKPSQDVNVSHVSLFVR